MEIYWETHAINKLADCTKEMQDEIFKQIGDFNNRISDITLLEITSTGRKEDKKYIERQKDLLMICKRLSIKNRGFTIFPNYTEILREDLLRIKENRPFSLYNCMSLETVIDYLLANPDEISIEISKENYDTKMDGERFWEELHENVHKNLKNIGEDQKEKLTDQNQFLTSYVESNPVHAFIVLLEDAIRIYGYDGDLEDLYCKSDIWRTFYFAKIYEIARYGIQGIKQRPHIDNWDVNQVVYVPFVDMCIVGKDLKEYYSWIAEKAKLKTKIQTFDEFIKYTLKLNI